MKRFCLALLLIAVLAVVRPGFAGAGAPTPSDPAAVELFEREIRPLFLEKCGVCHGEGQARSGLRLTSRAGLLRGGAGGPVVVPGRPDASRLIQAVEQRGPLKMPPGGKLSAAQIGSLRRWVALGAPWPTAPAGAAAPAPDGTFRVTDTQRRWWAYQRVRAAAPPPPDRATPVLGEIDRFLRVELRSRGLSPTRPADRRVLLRRATFDLTGLPPTADETTAFLDDRSSNAFAAVVDRLLASPAYGQRTARRWLDIARYADYHDGNPKARDLSCEPVEAWRYRDWVVNSFNRDLPFDRFIVHQIAGDLLPIPEGQEFYADGLVATTFLTNGCWDRGDADKEKMVSDMVDDQVDTVGKAFLGVTLGCARCHNHKFDPVSQADYYALAGMFYSTRILKEVGAKGGNYTLLRIPLAPKAQVTRWEEQTRKLNDLKAKLAELDKKQPPVPAGDPLRKALVAERDQLQAEMPPAPPFAEAAQEGGTPGGLFPKIGDVPIHIRGSYTRLGAVVPRRLPEFLAAGQTVPIREGSGRRELARWVASPENPLTARVIVNRVWQWHFGAGLVRTPNNFGMLSEPPSHPALLDWLAARFVADGWSLKKLHRRILLSAAYQQSSAAPPDQVVRDPENRWLGRFSPRRLDAEEVRDTILSAAGALDLTPGGPATADLNSPRRSLYVQTARWDRSNFATLFDAANPDASVEARAVSTVAPQALFLLNHEFLLAQAAKLRDRLLREEPTDDTRRLDRAYQLLFSRLPAAPERRVALQLLARPSKGDAGEAWRDLAHVLLCSNELVYLD